MNPPDLLEKLETALKAATPGAWVWSKRFDGSVTIEDDDEGPLAEILQGRYEAQANARAIIYLRNYTPALLAELKRLARVEAAAKAACETNPNLTSDTAKCAWYERGLIELRDALATAKLEEGPPP